jgi:hypothetical protein
LRIVAAIVSAVVLSLPASAAADSDGYFCVARGYLAYEMRSATTPSKHELHIVRFSTARGIVAAQPVILDDFQVHGMRCLPTVVELVGWETTHSVDISGSGQSFPTTASPALRGAGQPTAPGNLGHWSKPQVVTLDPEGENQFQLVIARVSQRVPGGIEHHTVSRLIQRWANHRPGREIIASQQLFEGVFLETVD